MPFTSERVSPTRRAFTGGLGALLLAHPALAASAIDEQGFVPIGGINLNRQLLIQAERDKQTLLRRRTVLPPGDKKE